LEFYELEKRAGRYLPSEKLEVLKRAYEFARLAHEGQTRKSGEPFIEHPLNVAMILAELQLDGSALTAALLHDVTEDCGIAIDQITKEFGKEISGLVEGATKLTKLARKVPGDRSRTINTDQAENLRKMLVAMAEDLRVVFIKLADRLHNMRTLEPLSVEKRRQIATETHEIYAPLAHRLGIWELKWQLEDLVFRYLKPRQYRHVVNLLNSRRLEREEFIGRIIGILSQELKAHNVKAEVIGRPKHLSSIFQKIERYAAQGKQFNDIYDLLAVRILVDTIPECYQALGVAHSMWRPLPGTFDDFIANPKPNGYQSLHTAVMCEGKTPLEVQIRSYEMNRISEYGVAAHWRYKEGEKQKIHFEERISWLRQLIDWQRELSGAEEFLESVKTDIFKDQVFVFTPQGDIKDLPKGATPLDFAYRIHTELGHRCIGAKVNGRLVPLNYQLSNGEVVEIMATKREKAPSRDWLMPHLGYVKTSHASEKIRQWFKKQERAENMERGREILEKESKQLGIKLVERDKLAKQFHFDSVDDFFAAIGYGAVSIHHIAQKLAVEEEQPRLVVDEKEYTPSAHGSAVNVMGLGDMLVNIARCCHPVPGDKIVGYVTRSRGVTVHRQDCHNVVKEEERERLVRVEWGARPDSHYPVNIQVEALDRVGLVRDVSTIVAEEKINIVNMAVNEHRDGTVSLSFALETKGLEQLHRIMVKIESIKGIISVNRVGDESTIRK
jgi:GTP pyrophosphokinase